MLDIIMGWSWAVEAILRPEKRPFLKKRNVNLGCFWSQRPWRSQAETRVFIKNFRMLNIKIGRFSTTDLILRPKNGFILRKK